MKTKKALSILTLFIFLVTILFTLTTCKKKTEDNPTTNDAFLISPRAKFIPDSSWQSMIRLVDSTNFTLTFDKALVSNYSLTQGDLIVSSAGNGLLRTIDAITPSGNNVQIQTSQATLTDLIQQGDIDYRSTLLVTGIKSITYYYPGIHLNTTNLKATNGKLFSLDINTEIAPLILLSGNFQCTQDFIFQLQISLLHGLTKVKFGFEGTEAFDLKLTAGKEFSLTKEVTLATVYFVPLFITIPVPPFEIVVVPVFDIKLGLDGSAVAMISTSLSQNLTLGTGIQYLKGPGWSNYKSVDKSINYTPPELTMNAAAEAYIKPELRMLLFNVVGPYMNGKGYGKIDADVAKTPWWKMYYGFTMSAGAKATILGKELFDYHVDDLVNWEQLVGQASGTSSDSVPKVSTNAVTNITKTTSTSGGNVTSQGSSAVTARGVCWNTSPSPTISNSYTTDGSGTGSFTSNLIGLSLGTPYYVRAYATNSTGTGYGNQVNFSTTNGSDSVPTVTTSPVINIAVVTATGGGNVTSQGSSPVTMRGICWSTSSNPTTLDSHTTDGNGTGSFTSNISGLTANTPYYVRAFATNGAGTAYGNEVSFTTLQTGSHYIGESYGGGIIFYIDGTGQHGIISATENQDSAEWGCSGTYIGGTELTIGSGQANTTAIINGCSTQAIAARICAALVLNGYSDWYLPSINELNQMYIHRDVIGGFGFIFPDLGYYWSSSEYVNEYGAYQFAFTNGTVDAIPKSAYDISVRAVRTF